jgi:hypothetical protein
MIIVCVPFQQGGGRVGGGGLYMLTHIITTEFHTKNIEIKLVT